MTDIEANNQNYQEGLLNTKSGNLDDQDLDNIDGTKLLQEDEKLLKQNPEGVAHPEFETDPTPPEETRKLT